MSKALGCILLRTTSRALAGPSKHTLSRRAMSSVVPIVDLRANKAGNRAIPDLRAQIMTGLSKPTGGLKTVPSVVMYDEEGLRLYDTFSTQHDGYYLFRAEEEIFKAYADEIVAVMYERGAARSSSERAGVVELGAGSLRKTSLLLRAFARRVREPTESAPVHYYALDLERRELERTLSELSASSVGAELHGKVTGTGLCATYDAGLDFIRAGGLQGGDSLERGSQISRQVPLHFLFIGSSLGNFKRGEDAAFLRTIPLRPGDTLLLGLDHDNPKEKIEPAYDDGPDGHAERLFLNAARVVGRALGDDDLFARGKWTYHGRYNEALRQHEQSLRSECDQVIVDPVTQRRFPFAEGELVRVSSSCKYSDADVKTLLAQANLSPVKRWMDSASQYSVWLVEPQA